MSFIEKWNASESKKKGRSIYDASFRESQTISVYSSTFFYAHIHKNTPFFGQKKMQYTIHSAVEFIFIS